MKAPVKLAWRPTPNQTPFNLCHDLKPLLMVDCILHIGSSSVNMLKTFSTQTRPTSEWLSLICCYCATSVHVASLPSIASDSEGGTCKVCCWVTRTPLHFSSVIAAATTRCVCDLLLPFYDSVQLSAYALVPTKLISSSRHCLNGNHSLGTTRETIPSVNSMGFG